MSKSTGSKGRGRNRNNSGKRSQGRGGNFDPNGGRNRGNAQQLMDKYLTLARDAASQGDRIAAENYHQHADHYYRVVYARNEQQAARRQAANAQGAGNNGAGNTGGHEGAKDPIPVQSTQGNQGPVDLVAEGDVAPNAVPADKKNGTADAAEEPATTDAKSEDKPAPKARRGRPPKKAKASDSTAPEAAE